jgi:hypothetical protein
MGIVVDDDFANQVSINKINLPPQLSPSPSSPSLRCLRSHLTTTDLIKIEVDLEVVPMDLTPGGVNLTPGVVPLLFLTPVTIPTATHITPLPAVSVFKKTSSAQ